MVFILQEYMPVTEANQRLHRHRLKSRDNPAFYNPFGAGNETRTRDPNLGKVVLYQLSYSRVE